MEYWENSVKRFLEKEKRNHIAKKSEEKRGLSAMKKNNKFDIGDHVKLDGYIGTFEVEEWSFEQMKSREDGLEEYVTYVLRSKGFMGEVIAVDESLISFVDPTYKSVEVEVEVRENLTSHDIDNLLDQYNNFTDIHNLLNHNGIVDNEYRLKADSILQFLTK